MNPENRHQHWEVYGVAVVVSGAVLAGLVFKGVTGETVSEAVKDIGAALIPILTAFLAARLVTREMDTSERFLRAGEDALRDIQRRAPEWLSGPKAHRESYDPENPGKAGRYLYLQKGGAGDKAQFVPVLPLKEGVVEIRVPKAGVVLLGRAQKGERDQQELAQKEIQAAIQREVNAALEARWKGTYAKPEYQHADIAIVVDFDETRLGPRKFRKAVVDCVEAAHRAVFGSR